MHGNTKPTSMPACWQHKLRDLGTLAGQRRLKEQSLPSRKARFLSCKIVQTEIKCLSAWDSVSWD